jgi:predicted alpha/beta superfamily hydrolase
MRKLTNQNVYFQRLGYEKNVTVFYEEGKKYEKVVYFHDSQNLWSAENSYANVSWEIQKLFNKPEMQNILVIGIDNSPTKRLDEYAPFDLETELKRLAPDRIINPQGSEYIDDILDCVIPSIEKDKVSDTVKRGIVGSSMGGLISTYAGVKYPGTFNYVGGLSNAYWFCQSKIEEYIKTEGTVPERMFLSVGNDESHDGLTNQIYLDSNKNVFDLFYGKTNVIFETVDNGKHHEIVWQEMIERVINYLFNQGANNVK